MYHYGLSSTQYKSTSCQFFLLQALCKRRYFVFTLSLDLTCLRGQRATWNHRRVSLVTSDYTAKFCYHRPCGRGDIKLLLFHVVSLDHVVRESCYIMVGLPPHHSHNYVKLGDYRPCSREDFSFLVCQVTSCEHVNGGSYDIMGEFPSSKSLPGQVWWSFGIMVGCSHSKLILHCLHTCFTLLLVYLLQIKW